MSRGVTPSAFNPATISDSDVPPVTSAKATGGASSNSATCPWHDDGLAICERVGLYDKRTFFHAQCQPSLGDCNPADAHICAHHDCSRALVDHHAGPAGRDNAQIFDPGQCMRRRASTGLRNLQNHGPRVAHMGNMPSEFLIDCLFDLQRGRRSLARLAPVGPLSGCRARNRPRARPARRPE